MNPVSSRARCPRRWACARRKAGGYSGAVTGLRGVSVLLLLAAGLAVGGTVGAQTGPQGRSWAEVAELPDWSGLWEVTFGGGFGESVPAFTPEYQARFEQYQAAQRAGDIQDSPQANCVPNGMPAIMTQPYPIEFLFTPGKVTILIEAYSQWRQVFTDGRGHPDDPDLTFNGHSIGYWEADTLVVDTVGFTTDTSIGRSFGMRHSDRMRIVERMRLVDVDTLEIETTLIDPVALESPLVSTQTYGRHRDWTLAEYVCQQNNRNFLTDDGQAGIDIEFED